METSDELTPAMRESLEKLLKLASVPAEGGVITPGLIDSAVERLKATIVQQGAQLQAAGKPVLSMVTDGAEGTPAGTPAPSGQKSVLIAGQLGIILHQLRQSLTKMGAEVFIAKDVDGAIAEYQKRDYALVIVDLFMPTEREGLIVLEEIKKISVVCRINTEIVVLAPSSRDRNIRDLCKAKGAAFFLEKMEGWHKTVLKYYAGEIDPETFDDGK